MHAEECTTLQGQKAGDSACYQSVFPRQPALYSSSLYIVINWLSRNQISKLQIHFSCSVWLSNRQENFESISSKGARIPAPGSLSTLLMLMQSLLNLQTQCPPYLHPPDHSTHLSTMMCLYAPWIHCDTKFWGASKKLVKISIDISEVLLKIAKETGSSEKAWDK